MHIQSTTQIGAVTLRPAAPTFANRLTKFVEQATQAISSLTVEPPGNSPSGGTTVLTASMLRDALLDLGLSADTQNMALAEAFAKLGLPLTEKTISEAHTALAGATGGTPLAFGLAKALGLPTTPATLKALATVTDGIPANATLSTEMMDMLSFSLHADMPSESLTGQIRMMAGQVGRSTENRIGSCLAGDLPVDGIQDLRSILLRLGTAANDRSTRIGANSLACHIEGQQLIAHACLQRNEASSGQTPFYFAFPVHFGSEPSMLEMSVHPWEEPNYDEELPDETPILRATIRISTQRVGRVQADIVGTLGGHMNCRLGLERPATARYVKQHVAQLNTSLTALGWSVSAIECSTRMDATPLWYGGEALTAPRTRGDWRA